MCVYIYILLALGRFRMQEMDIQTNQASPHLNHLYMLLLLYVKIDYLLVKYVIPPALKKLLSIPTSTILLDSS